MIKYALCVLFLFKTFLDYRNKKFIMKLYNYSKILALQSQFNYGQL